MAIKVNSNFEYQLKQYGDIRQSFATIAEMSAYNANLIPNGFITFCEENGKNYQWIDSNDNDAILNKWREFTAGSGADIDDTLDESATKTYSINKIRELIKSTNGFVIVESLPDLSTEDGKTSVNLNKIYLVKKADSETSNVYDEYICIHIEGSETVTESWSWELLGSMNDTGLAFDDFKPNNPIGKIVAGESLLNKDVISVIKAMLTVDKATTISLTTNPGTTSLNEKGVSNITDVILTASINLGTGVIADSANVIFKKNGTAISTQPFVKGTLGYTYTDAAANITDNTTYSVEVEYTMNETKKTASATAAYKFVLPIFYGVSTSNTVADITSLTKIISDKKSQSVSYTASNGYCVFCIPDTMKVKSIKDSNNFENINSWTSSTQSVTVNSEAVVYKVYVTNTPVTCNNFAYNITLA